MLKTIVFAVLAACAWGTATAQMQKNEVFRPEKIWRDTESKPINAHGGGIFIHKGTYYWYGEYKVGKAVQPEWPTWDVADRQGHTTYGHSVA